jgi:hypothetical protein
MKHMATAMKPAIYDPTLADQKLTIATEEAYAMCRRLAREEGVLVGPSAGANVAAALRVAREASRPPGEAERTVVTILCDSGNRYLATPSGRERIRVPAAVLEEIRAHAREAYPEKAAAGSRRGVGRGNPGSRTPSAS